VNARARLKEELRDRARVWAEKLRLHPKTIRVQKMTRKWGSCSTAGTITLALDLGGQTDKFRDYVIVHELLHLRYPSHGKLFKAVLSVHVPGWRKIQPAEFERQL